MRITYRTCDETTKIDAGNAIKRAHGHGASKGRGQLVSYKSRLMQTVNHKLWKYYWSHWWKYKILQTQFILPGPSRFLKPNLRPTCHAEVFGCLPDAEDTKSEGSSTCKPLAKWLPLYSFPFLLFSCQNCPIVINPMKKQSPKLPLPWIVYTILKWPAGVRISAVFPWTPLLFLASLLLFIKLESAVQQCNIFRQQLKKFCFHKSAKQRAGHVLSIGLYSGGMIYIVKGHVLCPEILARTLDRKQRRYSRDPPWLGFSERNDRSEPWPWSAGAQEICVCALRLCSAGHVRTESFTAIPHARQ